MKKRPLVLVPLLLLAATSTMAMSLGRYRGAALIGKPLDISVQAVLDAKEDLTSLCLEADVFFADSKVDPSRVQVTSERTSPDSPNAVIRVRVSSLIDEPVVTIYLRAGCQLRTSERKYVLLADLVSDPASQTSDPASTIALPTLPGAPVTEALNTTRRSVNNPEPKPRNRAVQREYVGKQASSSSASNEEAVGPGATQGSDSSAKPVPPISRPKAKAETRPKSSIGSKSKLTLDATELSVDRDPSLRSSTEMLSTPATTDQQRSAAAALWRALTAQPEDILRDTAKLKALEGSVAALQAEMQRNKLAINELNGNFQKAQSERYAGLVVYVLAGLLLIALAGIAFLWRQRSIPREDYGSELPWWRKNKPQSKDWDGTSKESSDSLMPGVMTGQKSKKKPQADVDLDLDLRPAEPAFPGVGRSSARESSNSLPPLSSRDRSEFAMSMTHMSRAVKAEELFDVQQQADFFVSLGQHEQAIEVLREHIDSNAQTSAVVYLDLFNLYHLLKRQSDYEKLGEEFTDLFNAKMPEFALYTDASPGLEAYPATLANIEALWPSPQVLDTIEDLIFRKIDVNAEAFDLGAYRELLLLYAIAKEVTGSESSPNSSAFRGGAYDRLKAEPLADEKDGRFIATSVQPLSAIVAEAVDEAHLSPVLPGIPRPSPRLGLDVDLSEVFENNSAHQVKTSQVVLEADADAKFFNQFASEGTVAFTPDSIAKPSNRGLASSDIDNLIDFDAFDNLVSPVQPSGLSKK